MLEAQHLIVDGRVQGVGFRFFTKNCADELKLTGWVRNLVDGRVEILVQGESAAVAKLVEQLQRGPRRSSVDKLHGRKIGLQDLGKEFHIIENGEEPCRIENL